MGTRVFGKTFLFPEAGAPRSLLRSLPAPAGSDGFEPLLEEVVLELQGDDLGSLPADLIRDHAFTHLNMNRVSLRVLADDARAVGAYRKAGFLEEGRLRQATWCAGDHHDELVMSVLRREHRMPGGSDK